MKGGNFTESKAGCTIWKGVKKETFERFVQFAYTGDYSIPEPIPRAENAVSTDSRSRGSSIKSVQLNGNEEAPEDIVPAAVEAAFAPADDDWGTWGVPMSKKDKKRNNKKKAIKSIFSIPNIPALAEDFRTLSYQLRASRNPYTEVCEPSEDFEGSCSYSNVFLTHAALYVLGDLWLIDSLKALALFKLHKTLCVRA